MKTIEELSKLSDGEPCGGNLYKPHALMVHSGKFWRCSHGSTGYGRGKDGPTWKGCIECAELLIDELRGEMKVKPTDEEAGKEGV
jgi:hypothetical protein